MSDKLKQKLAQIESELNEARDERVGLVQKREAAKDAFGETDGFNMESDEYKAAREAVGAVGAIEDKIADLQAAQVETLKMLGQGQSRRNGGADPRLEERAAGPNGWGSSGLFTEELGVELERISGSKSRFGSIQIGEVADRDALAADIGGTPNMRRGTDLGIIPQIFRPLRVLDLLPIGTTDGNNVPYTQEGGTFNAAETAESAAKPEDGVTFTDANAPVQTIAAWQKIRKQALSDVAALRSIIDARLRYSVMRRLEAQVLAGNGVGSNLTGILNTAGIGAVPFDANVPLSELLLTGITNTYLADGEATGIVLNPADWQKTLTEKAHNPGGTVGSYEYLSGGPFSVTPQVIWGVPLVPSPALAAGFGLVGDFTIGAQLLIREGVNVLLSDSDQDDFTKNRVTLLGEMRAALPVFRPVAFQTVDLLA